MIVNARQTLARAYAELTSGVEGAERTAIGDFMNEFFLYAVEDRQALLDEPLEMPEHPSEDQRGWAAFCAASAEYLAERYDLVCPVWAHDPAYTLDEPWYHPASRVYPGLREHFEKTVPDAFRRHSVFCSDHVFTNAHPSSREPGALADLEERRAALLAELPEAERSAYLAEQQAAKRGKLRYRIVA